MGILEYHSGCTYVKILGKLFSIPVTVQPCDWQKREIEKVFSSDYPHGNT